LISGELVHAIVKTGASRWYETIPCTASTKTRHCNDWL